MEKTSFWQSEAADKKKELQLIAKAAKGDSQAFSHLVARYHRRVAALGMSFFKNATDTEDFLQDVFIKVYTKLHTFRGESLFSTWLLRIAYMYTPQYTESNLVDTLIVLSVLAGVIIFVIIIEVLIYTNLKSYPKWTLYVLRFVFEIFPIIGLSPAANFVGISLTIAIETQSMNSIIYSCVGIIYYLIFLLINTHLNA